MSSTVDVNVLLYASDETSRFHDRARELVDRLAVGAELLYLFWPVLMGYLRVATHPAVFTRPLPVEDAIANVDQLLAIPHVRAVGERDDFWRVYAATTAGMVVRGNLVPDAHLVALMRQNEVGSLWTHDRDFRKFEGIRVRDPFA
jgi:toxin-antitoxin system PIN domain toxin